MKKFICILCACTLLNTQAMAKEIYSTSETVAVSKSISLTKVEEFHADHNINYYVIKADLSDPDTALKLLTSKKGMDKLDTVNTLAKSEEDIVCALNADFFSLHEGANALPLGVEVKENKLISSPINPDTMATIAYLNDTLSMFYMDFHIMAVAPNGEYQEIRHLNKHTSYYGDLLMYTSEFNGGFSPAPGGEVVEVVVSGGVITEFRRNMPPVEIPEDGCVIVVSEGSTMFMANNFQVGDPIKFDYYAPQEIFDAESAFGGGAMLVQNGKAVTTFSHKVAGNHPRSAIGTDKDGKTLYLVAVDGRQEISRGMQMSTLAKLLVNLGCYTAVNLDGGGSTNLVVSTSEKKPLHTINSPSTNRPVINAVGVTYSAEESDPYGITIKSDKDCVFIGDSVNLEGSVFDENMRPLDHSVEWSASGGNIQDGVFTAAKGGVATVFASYGDITESKEIFVVDKISGISTNEYLSLEKDTTAELTINVFDESGHFVTAPDGTAFEITSSNPDSVEVSGNKIKAVEDGNAIITVKKDNAVAYCSVAVGEEEHILAPDNVYDAPQSDDGANVRIGVHTKKADTLLSKLVNDKIEEVVKESKAYSVTSKKGFEKSVLGDNLFLGIDTSKGGIRATDSKQWDSLYDAISSAKANNIFITSRNSVFGTDDIENKVITEYLSDVDKNVYVVTGGEQNTYKNIGGVHYFTVGNTVRPAKTLDYIQNVRYLEVNTQDNSFSFKNVY